MRVGRRHILGMGAALAAAPLAAFANSPMKKPSRPLYIDVLGGLSDPNVADAPFSLGGMNERALRDGKASGLTAFNQTIGYVAGPQDPFEYSLRDIGLWDRYIQDHPNELTKILTAQDIRNAHRDGKMGVILGFQNAAMLGQDATRASLFANLGIRVIQLTYNVRNQLGDGSAVAENHGLTDFGKEALKALQEARVMVDLSHSGEQTCLDAIALAEKPIIISHTGCRALNDLPRNKTDRELRGVAQKGGIVGIYCMPFLVDGRQPMAEDLLNHIDHALQICGEDHVALGTDGSVPRIDDMAAYYEHLRKEVAERRAAGIGAKGERDDIVLFLPDLQGPEKFARLAELLVKRGHKQTVADKVLGSNFLRVAGEIWPA